MLSLVEVLEVLIFDSVSHGLLLAWSKSYLLEVLEFLLRTDHTCLVVAYIPLHNLLACYLACVLDSHSDLVAVDLRLAILECGVAQAIAEWEKHTALRIGVSSVASLGVEPAIAEKDVFGINDSLVAMSNMSHWVERCVASVAIDGSVLGNLLGLLLEEALLEQVGRERITLAILEYCWQ